MTVNFFIPKKINVGFQSRNGTYTGKLAYIIYFDEKGKLRKEKSWNSWRDDSIDNQIVDNEPMSGFVLNKKAGGYDTGWNHRQTYVRVYDPRGYEFEITVPNLLYILENATSTKGKGLEGDFVYGWDGKDLVLIPCDSPDWKELVNLNKLRHSDKKIGARDIKVGAEYRTRQNEVWVYMGKHDEYDYSGTKKDNPKFWFYNRDAKYNGFEQIGSVASKLVEVISEECVEDFADIHEKMEGSYYYSPFDESLSVYEPYTIEELREKFADRHWVYFFTNFDEEVGMKSKEIRFYDERYGYYKRELVERNYGYGSWNQRTESRMEDVRHYLDDLEEVFNIMKPHKKIRYLANGRLYGEATY